MIKLTRPECPHPRSLENRSTYKHASNKAALLAAAHGKCMYCESFIDHTQYGDVEHVKPKAAYPENEFDWSNLGFACTTCNNSKNDDYDPTCPFIDPYSEEPSDLLVANGSWLFAKPGNERGQITIEAMALNRAQLIERRAAKVTDISRLVDRIAVSKSEKLKAMAKAIVLLETADDKEFSFVARTAADAFMAHI